MKVLISAYACEPDKGSEPGVGWHWAREAARCHDVWVLTRANNRPAIEAELVRDPAPRLRVVYHDLPAWARSWKRGKRGLTAYYLLWQATALGTARRLHRDVGFDLVHHVTFNAIDTPGFLWRLGPPFVWGPVGGAQVPPTELKAYFGAGWWRQRVRAIRKRLLRFDPIVRAATRRAALILAANREAERVLRDLGARRVCRRLEAGVTMPEATPPPRPGDGVLTILWAGGLIPRKAPMLALDVLTELKRLGVPARLLIAGKGPLRAELEAAIRARSLDGAVELLGALPHAAMGAFYGRGDAFLFTSLQDTSGNVVLEAMARGLPAVALDHHGAAEMVTPETGLLVPVDTPERVIAGFATALQCLAADPDLRAHMGEVACRRARDVYAWDRLGPFLRDLYATAAGRPTELPTPSEAEAAD
jgi:glycosyltransferase involved in cell wall biosynthesis